MAVDMYAKIRNMDNNMDGNPENMANKTKNMENVDE